MRSLQALQRARAAEGGLSASSHSFAPQNISIMKSSAKVWGKWRCAVGCRFTYRRAAQSADGLVFGICGSVAEQDVCLCELSIRGVGVIRSHFFLGRQFSEDGFGVVLKCCHGWWGGMVMVGWLWWDGDVGSRNFVTPQPAQGRQAPEEKT